MKTLILYKSKYGATKEYAMMLKAVLSCDMYAIDDTKMFDLQHYDRIIFAGAIYASGIAGLSTLKKYQNILNDKQLIIFCVGASPLDQAALQEIKERNLKDGWEQLPLFYGRGAWDESRMTFVDRTLCKFLQKAVAKKDRNTCAPWEKALLESMGKRCHWVDHSYLVPLLEYVDTISVSAKDH